MRRFAPSALALLATLALPAVAGALTPPDKRPGLADFTARTLDGGRLTLAHLRGKVVVLSFWATWCQPCKQELPILQSFQDELGEKDLAIVTVNTDAPRTVAMARQVFKRAKLSLPVLLDPEGRLASTLNPRNAMPFTLYVDRLGRVAAEHTGYASGDEKEMRETIDALLAEPAEAAGKTP